MIKLCSLVMQFVRKMKVVNDSEKIVFTIR